MHRLCDVAENIIAFQERGNPHTHAFIWAIEHGSIERTIHPTRRNIDPLEGFVELKETHDIDNEKKI